MRPNVSVEAANRYECIACGERATDPETRACPECGATLRNLARSRDV